MAPPENNPLVPSKRARRVAGWAAFALGLAACCLPSYPFVEHFRGRLAIQSIDKKHRRAGMSWTMPSKPNESSATNAFLTLSNALEFLPPTLPGYSFRRALTGPGRLQSLAASPHFLERDWHTNKPLKFTFKTNSWAVLEQAVASNGPALMAVTQALAAPRLAVPECSPKHPTFVPLAVVQLKFQAAWWLEARGLAALRRDDPVTAIDSVQWLRRAADLLLEPPSEPVQGSRREILRRAVWLSWEVLQHPRVSAADLDTLRETWRDADATKGLANECRHEFIRLRKSLHGVQDPEGDERRALLGFFRDPGREDWAEQLIGEQVLPHLVSAWVYLYAEQTEAHFARHAADLIGVAGECLERNHYQPWRQASERLEAGRSESGYYTMLRVGGSMIALSGVRIEGAAKVQTEIALLRTALALRRHRIQAGTYPEKLEELPPEVATMTNQDWFSGQPLHYRRLTADDSILYSVGIDGVDNQAEALKTPKLKPLSLWNTSDAIWPGPATTEAVWQRLSKP